MSWDTYIPPSPPYRKPTYVAPTPLGRWLMKRISWPVKIEIVPPCLVFAPPNTAATVHVRQ